MTLLFTLGLLLGLSESAARGRQIYRGGVGVTAVLAAGGIVMPAASFPCANCHGFTGEGTQEGGVAPPALAGPRFAETTVIRAVTHGAGPAMPAYRMSSGQMADLLAYLKILGTDADADPGVTPDRIRLGTELPLDGPLGPLGREIHSALWAAIDAVNEQGGVYGRTLELKLSAKDDEVFALVAPYHSSGAAFGGGIPVIGPLTFDGTHPGTVFHLMPGIRQQSGRPAALAREAIVFLVEGLRAVGRDVTRPTLVEALRKIEQSRSPITQ